MNYGTLVSLANAFVLGLSLGAAGCEAATNAANGVGAFAEKAAERIEQKTSDAAIVVAVKGALVKEDETLGRTVSVGSLNGVVSLAGTAPSAEAKAKAETLALKVDGVVRVRNTVEVRP